MSGGYQQIDGIKFLIDQPQTVFFPPSHLHHLRGSPGDYWPINVATKLIDMDFSGKTEFMTRAGRIVNSFWEYMV